MRRGKLDRKKDRVVSVLQKLLGQDTNNKSKNEFIQLSEYGEDLDYNIRMYIEKLNKYTKRKKKHKSKNYKEFKDDLRKYQNKYIEQNRILYDEIKRELNLQESYDELLIKKRDQIIALGLKEILNSEGVLKDIYEKSFNKEMPKHPKDEHPVARSMKRKFVIHAGPTNSGKTYQSLEKLKQAESGMYLAPLRLLALEVYEKLNMDGVPCDLITGEEEVRVPLSKHYSSTIEKADFKNKYDLVVIDEGQIISDEYRGNSWFRAILGILSKEIHICCSLSGLKLIKRIIKECDDDLEIIFHERKTPLVVEGAITTIVNGVEPGDALIAFSRKQVLSIAAKLEMRNIKTSVIYGNLPPQTRRKQVELFNNGETSVVVATDSIGMGINLPVKRVVFTAANKFDGKEIRELNSQEVKQIAGRAGRQGLFDIGFVAATKNLTFFKDKIAQEDPSNRWAIIEPLEDTILSLNFGTLKDKLEHWLNFEYRVPYVKKANIESRIKLIDLIPVNIITKLTEKDVYRAIHIPFDSNNEILLNKWLDYLSQLTENPDKIAKPDIFIDADLETLETLYREIDLYYSFSKSFELLIDEEWVNEVREGVSEEIHQKLMDRVYETFN